MIFVTVTIFTQFNSAIYPSLRGRVGWGKGGASHYEEIFQSTKNSGFPGSLFFIGLRHNRDLP
jgi:hypothetical protein